MRPLDLRRPLPETITVEVTAAMIRAGRRTSCDECPVALGFIARGVDVVVGHFGATVSVPDRLTPTFREYRIPRTVGARIRTFDEGGPMQPFRFTARHVDI